MKKLVSWILILALMICILLPAGAERLGEIEYQALQDANLEFSAIMPVFESVDEITAKTVPFYIGATDQVREITLYFINDNTDVPFLNVEDLGALLELVWNTPEDSGIRCTSTVIGSSLYIERDNGSFAVIDFNDKTIAVEQIYRFNAPAGEDYGIDISGDVTPSGSDATSFLERTKIYVRQGGVMVYRLGNYKIPMILKDYAGYIPLATVSDFFFSDNYINLVYNGVNAFAIPNGAVSFADVTKEGSLSALYYDCPKGMKSDALTQLTYNELCLVLDCYYGLAEEHNVISFDKLFFETGLVSKLLSKDPLDTYTGLCDLTMNFFHDGHSAAGSPGYLSATSGQTDEVFGMVLSSVMDLLVNMATYSNARSQYYPEGVVGYEEVDDTAYITFDSFVRDNERKYRDIEPENNPNDTLELILYANQQIHRENSPIKYVVLDLTNNGGGMADTALYTLSWLLGSTRMTLLDTANGTESTVAYSFDGNRNGEFNEPDDYIGTTNYKIFCLISPFSFSCGNLVPSVLKNSDQVTLIGQTSGGGSCVVLPLAAADGTLFNVSGHLRISFVKNGSFYNVDKGMDPDVYISNPEHLYDRQYLTDLIHQMP